MIHDLAHFMIYGKKGILKLTDPNTFGGNVIFLPAQKNFEDHPAPEILNYGFSYEENSRGLGPSEMQTQFSPNVKAAQTLPWLYMCWMSSTIWWKVAKRVLLCRFQLHAGGRNH